MQKISIITPTYNEEDNVLKLIEEVKRVFSKIPEYSYEHIFIDNSSLDRTVEILREEAKTDSRIKIIVNSRNFGHIRSPYYGLLQCTGDAAILLVADLQDPPDLIIDLVKKWEEGNDLVMAVKSESYESKYIANCSCHHPCSLIHQENQIFGRTSSSACIQTRQYQVQ